jgi:hypothetical protein
MFVSSSVTRICIAAALTASLAGAMACSKSDSPTSPTPTASGPVPAPAPTPTPPPAPAPNPVGAVQITVNPNPVPHSGTPITDAAGCVGVRFTWFYDQVFQETGGAAVTFTNRIDLFDDRETNNISNLNVAVGANGTNSVRSRWCSSNRGPHTAQTRWTGTDASGRTISVLGPRVTLSAAP